MSCENNNMTKEDILLTFKLIARDEIDISATKLFNDWFCHAKDLPPQGYLTDEEYDNHLIELVRESRMDHLADKLRHLWHMQSL